MNSENLSTLLLEGINLIFEKWTVLRLAVTNNWGGTSSEEKKKKLIEYVHNYVLSNTTPKDKLCDYLRDEIEVSDLILDLYKDLKNNNLEIIEKIRNIQESDLNSCREHNLIQEANIDEEEDSASEYSDENDSNEAYSDSYQSEDMQ
ncbi:hypothetical protein [Plasmodium yoelii yoelii]|uniref:Pre-rRNA-processing protein TSR2 n=1 Tax=Plasmodium yoelii yoelii TaxID=73239 RepID=Q7RMB9_PLAYO|nr:hypothetical protein [Plasmodium yoelii yoelii]